MEKRTRKDSADWVDRTTTTSQLTPIQPVPDQSVYITRRQSSSLGWRGLRVRTTSHRALWLQGLTGTCVPAWHALLLSLTTTVVDTPPCPFWAMLCSGPHIVLWALPLHLYPYQKNPARRRTSDVDPLTGASQESCGGILDELQTGEGGASNPCVRSCSSPAGMKWEHELLSLDHG